MLTRAALLGTSAKPSGNRDICELSKAPFSEHNPDVNANPMMQKLKPFLVRSSLAVWLASTPGMAAEPANPDLIPEARKVLEYLESAYGEKTLTGMSSYGGWRPVYEMSGRAPAIYGNDAFGWNKPKWGASYCKVLQGAIDSTRDWWLVKGGIPQMQFHWGKPGDPDGSAWVSGNKGTGPVDMSKFITPGTTEHTAAMEDLKRTADYLEQLTRARVPVLWRPFHEIDGGWFWWTDKENPENTAAAWRMMFDYFVKERRLHNLIWVFNPGVHAGGYQQWLRKEKRAATLADEIAFRKRYYPGSDYVDLAGIDIYPNPGQGYGNPTHDTYRKAWDIMKQVAPGKVLALCETAALVDPDTLQQDGPAWLYVLPWFAGGANPPEWIRSSFNHAQYLTLDELPLLSVHNVAPHVRLVELIDGFEAGSSLDLKAVAGDRNGNLAGVEFRVLPGPWKDWAMRDGDDLEEALSNATRLGAGEIRGKGEYTFTWSGIPTGLHDLAAVARDTEGRTTVSRIARVAVGVTNVARAKPVTSSSAAKSNPGRAVDGDLYQGWSGDKEGEQWLAVDLGSELSVGAATITWWKAYARVYAFEISSDGSQWREVFRQPKKTGYIGDTDIIRFAPVTARHVRLKCLERATDWGGYTVYELGVYESLPERDSAR